MKYIFLTGAPGSKWSSVSKNIYYSPDIDRSDFTINRTYFHQASGKTELMHIGAYFDPGMEFGNWFRGLYEHSKEECEAEFDRPFSGEGIRIIKCHMFAYDENIKFLRDNWPDCPIILVHRPDDACLGWWVKCGHFDITYPNYQDYENFKLMAGIIQAQNIGILRAAETYKVSTATTNLELCDMLGIRYPPEEYQQNYNVSDLKVKVIN
jgi:hypothetical protein